MNLLLVLYNDTLSIAGVPEGHAIWDWQGCVAMHLQPSRQINCLGPLSHAALETY